MEHTRRYGPRRGTRRAASRPAALSAALATALLVTGCGSEEQEEAPEEDTALTLEMEGTCTTAGGELRGGGTGFTPNGDVRLEVLSPDGQPYTGPGGSGTFQALPTGETLDLSWNCAGDPPGEYTSKATDVATGRTVTTTFTIDPAP